MDFLQWNVFDFDANFTKIRFWQYGSMDSSNGLEPNRRQAIIWTNADTVHWHIYAALGEMA